jgi:hypothetical protein
VRVVCLCSCVFSLSKGGTEATTAVVFLDLSTRHIYLPHNSLNNENMRTAEKCKSITHLATQITTQSRPAGRRPPLPQVTRNGDLCNNPQAVPELWPFSAASPPPSCLTDWLCSSNTLLTATLTELVPCLANLLLCLVFHAVVPVGRLGGLLEVHLPVPLVAGVAGLQPIRLEAGVHYALGCLVHLLFT